MRKAARALAVASLTALTLPLSPVAAHAETTTEAASMGAYFWEGKLGSTIGGQPNPANGQDTDADGVARDDLAVALTTQGENESDKETFLAWDLFELDSGATISKFVVTMPLTEKGPNPDPAQNSVQSRAGEALLRACAPEGGFGTTDAGPYEVKPKVNFATCVPGAFDAAKKAYVFDVTALTSTWLSGANNGIAIVPDKPTEQSPFQVIFQPFAAHVAEIEYTPGPNAELEEPAGGFDSGASSTDFGSTTSDFGSSSGSSDSFLSSAPSSSFGTSSGSLTSSLDVPLPESAPADGDVAPEPEVADQQVRTAPVAQRSVSAGPPIGFWLLAVLLAAALVMMSLATGAPVTPASAKARAGRVLETVQRRAMTRRAT